MAFSRNDSDCDISFMEFKDDFKDPTRQALTIYSHSNGQQTHQNTEETCNAETINKNCTSLLKHETNSNVDIKIQGNKICIDVLGFSVAQFGSDTKALEEQSYKLCSKDCYSSTSDEENGISVALKIPVVIFFPMPVIQKRGCMNTSWYPTIIAKLKEKQKIGDFDGHENMVEILMAKSVADFDMQMSLQIERAMVLYFQNKFKRAKKILKIVLNYEYKLKNPGILVGRTLNFLTAVYKHQGKFGKAMECVERARTCLEGQDSANDKAELHHSYGALIMAMPAARDPETVRTTKEEAYKSYQIADYYEFQKYHHVKMAALLLEPRFRAERIVNIPCKEDIMKAKNHLNFVESILADNKPSRTRKKFLLLRSDQYLYENNVPMAMEKAQEAIALIDKQGFKLERAAAKSRIDHLSSITQQPQENVEWREAEFSSSSGTSDYLAESESAHSD